MSIFHDSALIGSGGGAAAYQINQSLRFNGDTAKKFYRTNGSDGTSRASCASMWVKLADFVTNKNGEPGMGCLQWKDAGSCAGVSAINYQRSHPNTSIATRFNVAGIGSDYTYPGVQRDPSGWYHLFVSMSNSSTLTGFWINGVQQSHSGSSASGYQFWNGNGRIVSVGTSSNSCGANEVFNGYIAEIHFVDNATKSVTDFGEFDTITGAWIPKKYSGSYGTNGFYLKFDPSATNGIGHDHSGNGNNFTSTGFSTSGTGTDVMSDTPTNNWCTLNPLIPSYQGSPTYSEGNLQVQMSGGGQGGVASQAVTTGKWYAEITISNAGNRPIVGICPSPNTLAPDRITPFEGVGYYYDGTKYVSNSGSSYGSSWTTNDIIGIALDLDSGTKTVTFYKNNTSQGAITLPSNSGFWLFCSAGSGSDGNGTFLHNFGQRAFAYTPPTGFKALNTANLPEPTIKKGGAHFNTVLYTGNGSYPRAVTGLGFSPDWVWLKSRVDGYGHGTYDRVRGVGTSATSLRIDGNGPEGASEIAPYIDMDSFDANGFTLGNTVSVQELFNLNSKNYVAWCWKAANTSGSSNTAGSITSTVSANASAGFSIVTYTGNATSNATVGHGLGVAPGLIIVKNRSSSNWWKVYHKSLGIGYYINLNDAYGASNSGVSSVWGSSAPSSTVFSLGSGADGSTNASGNNYVAYCFSEVAGYSKFGSYVGNGSTDGPFVFCGFKPRWILVKASSVSGYSWICLDTQRDSYNVSNKALRQNLSDVELANTLSNTDLLSNGFKLRTTWADMNSSGTTYIFAAFAELPFKYANAR